jgi:epoxyqueuosine reductase
MGNSKEKSFVPYIKKCLEDKDPLVRAHAAWALWKLQGEDSYETLSNHLSIESNPMVREEIVSILDMKKLKIC